MTGNLPKSDGLQGCLGGCLIIIGVGAICVTLVVVFVSILSVVMR